MGRAESLPVTRAFSVSLLFSLAGLAGALALTGCDGLKSAPAGGSPESGTGGDVGNVEGGSSPLSPSAGPGAHGSLPSGYCCTQDAECRGRHCVAVGAGKMCLDTCQSQSACEARGREGKFKCDGAQFEEGLCQPIAASAACVPQAMFIRGTRKVGDCCAATGDGNAGDECEGNRCVSIGENGVDNPFVCSHWCESTKDCPSPSVCSPFNDCVPANRPYTCN